MGGAGGGAGGAGALRAAWVQVPGDDRVAQIRLETAYAQWDGVGFCPVRVRITQPVAQPGVWRLRFMLGHSWNRETARLVSEVQVVASGRGDTETVVYVPGPGLLESGLQVEVQGPGFFGNTNKDLVRTLGGGGWDSAQVVVGAQAEQLLRPLLPMAAATGGGHSGVAPYVLVSHDPGAWPADARVWSGLNSLVLAYEEWQLLSAAHRQALSEWVALGGHLVLLNRPFEAAGLALGGLREIERLGLGEVRAAESGEFWGMYGRHVASAARLVPWQGKFTLINPADLEARRIGRVSGWLLLGLVAFAVLVGPVNVFVLAPPGRRHRLFFTVPLFSLAASLVVGVVIVLGDGFGGEGTRRALIMLLPGQSLAVQVQEQVARTGLLWGSAFTLPPDVWATLKAVNDADGKPKPLRGQLQRTGERLAGEWFMSRTTQALQLRRLVPTRARVERVVERAGVGTGAGAEVAPVVLSSFAGVLRDFRFLDTSGRLWRAEELAPGQRVTLIEQAREEAGWLELAPGEYTAFLDPVVAGELAPLDTLASIRWTQESVQVCGQLEKGGP